MRFLVKNFLTKTKRILIIMGIEIVFKQRNVFVVPRFIDAWFVKPNHMATRGPTSKESVPLSVGYFPAFSVMRFRPYDLVY